MTAETVWMHVGCGGPVYFTLAGGWCQQCGAGPLHPYSGDRYAHRDDQADDYAGVGSKMHLATEQGDGARANATKRTTR